MSLNSDFQRDITWVVEKLWLEDGVILASNLFLVDMFLVEFSMMPFDIRCTILELFFSRTGWLVISMVWLGRVSVGSFFNYEEFANGVTFILI